MSHGYGKQMAYSSLQYSSATVSFAISIKSSMILVATFASYGLISIGSSCFIQDDLALRKIKINGTSVMYGFPRRISDSSFIRKNMGTSSCIAFFCLSSSRILQNTSHIWYNSFCSSTQITVSAICMRYHLSFCINIHQTA